MSAADRSIAVATSQAKPVARPRSPRCDCRRLARTLDATAARWRAPPRPRLARQAPLFEEALREAHLPAQQPQAQEEARLPAALAHSRWPRGAQEPPPARPQAPQRLTERIRDRATFEALAEVRRRRRGPLSLRLLPGGESARVAYAVGRDAGGAVQRNRIRRRLRAAVAELERDGHLGPGAYLFGAGAGVTSMPYPELLRALTGLVEGGAEAGS